ncbi:non-muscle caldesmon-like isoform X1 [Poecilia latipinna]|uniref:non-muscle caldesmon-like isoform X1 n=1 Tax=Poecilia latipinna TaxID=48699 RepID=UPI00072EA74F|nr:PREDICTED: non-muscle caldesmon-like isoform X1 [Poecilia latipinna]XP_014880008.1 PREDICTED: non-muscle caldesmon-like isoform X1 [Poecilia latipinna]XP_014880015.1 PREDICTED: non-muscle caldesmon-like isoform X1 [Poecilia latipinna]
MEDMDFERRRELRRQKREEMRLEAERMLRNDDDEEEAARERRRRARQERLRNRESEEPSSQPDGAVLTNSHSVTESVSVSSSYGGGGDDEELALQERMAKREERRQRRMKEALERQKQLEPAGDGVSQEKNSTEEERQPWRSRRYRDTVEDEEKTESSSSRREEKEQEEPREEEEEPAPEREEEELEEEEEEKVEVVETKPRKSNLREQASAEESVMQHKDLNEDETHSVVGESSSQAKSANSEAEEDSVASGEDEEVPEDDYVDIPTESKSLLLNDIEEDFEVSDIQQSEDNEQVNEREESEEDQRKHNGGLHDEAAPKQHRKPERTLSRGSVRSPEVSASDEQDDDARLEAERKLEELKRRRDDAESEEFERMRQKQQEAEAELEELKRKREERRKVLEEEERQRKQEEAERKAREEEEKRKMKEEIERRRAEAAEKRQKVDDTVDGEGKPFKCVSPRGSSLKIGERAEFLNKSAQKSSVKASHSPVVSKIDNRLEQYTSAAQRENKESKSPRSTVLDLPMVTDVRNIKSMWEKGNVFSSPGSAGSTFKEAAVIKTGVAGRINDWLNKTPESGKTSGGRPTDLKPVDVTNKRSLWENKGATPTKMAGRGETKSVANGMGY